MHQQLEYCSCFDTGLVDVISKNTTFNITTNIISYKGTIAPIILPPMLIILLYLAMLAPKVVAKSRRAFLLTPLVVPTGKELDWL